MSNIMHSFFVEASAKHARSTALHALQWTMGGLLLSLPVFLVVDAPTWLLYLICGALVIVLAIFLGAYIYLLRNDRDSLRSDTFVISKLAIERGLVGDSLLGLHKPDSIDVAQSDPKTLLSDEGPTS